MASKSSKNFTDEAPVEAEVPKAEPVVEAVVDTAVTRAPASIAGTPGKGGVYRMVNGKRVKINR